MGLPANMGNVIFEKGSLNGWRNSRFLLTLRPITHYAYFEWVLGFLNHFLFTYLGYKKINNHDKYLKNYPKTWNSMQKNM